MCIEGRTGGYGGGNDIHVGFGTVKVTRYLCGSCGFSEEWIDAPEDLHSSKKNTALLKQQPPNQALHPTPPGSARASLRLPARLIWTFGSWRAAI